MTPEQQEQIFLENRNSLWTPYNIQVLLHHYASAARFPGDEFLAYPNCIAKLRAAGLMEQDSLRLTLAGGRFVIALCNMPVIDPMKKAGDP